MLAGTCDYFEKVFYGNCAKKNKDKVALENVSANDFRKFLDVVYSSARHIDGKQAIRVFGGNSRTRNKFRRG